MSSIVHDATVIKLDKTGLCRSETSYPVDVVVPETLKGEIRALELATLRQAMSADAKEADHIITAGKIAEAEKAAEAKDSSQVAGFLKAAGNWDFDTITKIGVSVASEAIRQSMGMK